MDIPKLSSVVLVFIIIFKIQSAYCRGITSSRENNNDSLRNSIEFSPMSPFINIYAVYYNYLFSKSDEGLIGPVYLSIPYEDIGRSHAIGIIIGYRRYFF